MLYIMTADGWKPWLPTCVPCPNSNDLQGVFRARPVQAVEAEMSLRADRFISALEKFHPMTHGHEFRGHHFVEPVVGAFGEKL